MEPWNRSTFILGLCAVSMLCPKIALSQCANWQAHNGSGDKALHELKYDLAQQEYIEATRLARDNHCDWNYVAVSTMALADVYKYEGRYTDSEQLFADANGWVGSIPVSKRFPGLEATLLNNLADLYLEMARFIDAEALAKRSIEIRKREFGKKSPAYAISVSTLGGAYLGEGRGSDAEPLFREALAVLSKKRPESLRAYVEIHLAKMLTIESKRQEAEIEAQLAVDDMKKAGSDHPGLATALVTLADLERGAGNYPEAMSNCKLAIAIDTALFKGDHPAIARDLNALAETYAAQEQYAEAEPLFHRALAARKQLLDPAHPDYKTTLEDYAKLLRATGRDLEASQLKD
jgi:hypothetical protein